MTNPTLTYITVAEASKQLGISRNTLLKRTAEGLIGHVLVPGCGIRYRAEDLAVTIVPAQRQL